MTAGIIALILTAVGTVLIAIGVYVSLADRKQALADRKGLEAKGAAGDPLAGLAKLAEAMKDHPLGMQLILIGVALLLAAGATGGIGAVAAA